MTDPLSTYEAAEADAVERQDEARREQHWREAVDAAREALTWAREKCEYTRGGMYSLETPRWERDTDAAIGVLMRLSMDQGDQASEPYRVLEQFMDAEGTAALLRVLGEALAK